MIVRIRKMKTILIIVFILIAFHICFIETISSSIFKCTSNVKLNYDLRDTSQKITPLSETVRFPFNVSYQIEGVFAERAVKYLSKKGITPHIDIRIKKKPSWCTAMIYPDILLPKLATEWVSEEAYITVAFDDQAPAYDPAVVIIEMQTKEISTFLYEVKGVTKTAELSFVPAYLPIIEAIPHNTTQVTKPGKTVVFNIELQNLGNAETEFIFNVLDIPAGWKVDIPSNMSIGSFIWGDDYKGAVQFSITPPKDVGSRNIREVINLKVTGQYFAGQIDETMETAEVIMSFTVEVEGNIIWEPGFLVPILFVIIIALILVLIKFGPIIKKHYSK